MDEVFYPMMIKLDDLVKKNPTKGDFQGAYIPKYLVDEAHARIRHLTQPHNPGRIRGSQGGIEEALEAQVEQAYKAGKGDRNRFYQQKVGDTFITSRDHYGGGPGKKKTKPEVLRKLKIQDKQRGIKTSGSL